MELQIVPASLSGAEIVWEKQVIKIPFNTTEERDKIILHHINSLKNRIYQLENASNNFEFLSLTKEQTRVKVIQYLKSKKLSGHGKIEVFEISSDLRINANQIEDVLEELKENGLVKDI